MLDQALIIDTETTGIDKHSDKLVELAAIRYSSDEAYSEFCNPGRDIPAEAMAVHHITKELVEYAPSPSEIVLEMLANMGTPSLLIAHNAKFDRDMLRSVWPAGGPRIPWVCTMKVARAIWPDAPRHTNQVLRYWLGLSLPEHLIGGLAPHRALYDIVVTREIFRAALTKMPLEEMIELSNKPSLLKKVGFGKHKGKLWSEVDSGYLRWCLSQPDIEEDVAHTARHYLSNRR